MVSVVIPTFNSERYIAELLDRLSIQSIKPEEILIVDFSSGPRHENVSLSA